jgi:hypothetical protein
MYRGREAELRAYDCVLIIDEDTGVRMRVLAWIVRPCANGDIVRRRLLWRSWMRVSN